jgi:hypothetical protein
LAESQLLKDLLFALSTRTPKGKKLSSHTLF